MLTLHPQSAMEHLHQRYIAADGTGSSRAIAFEGRGFGPAGNKAGPVKRPSLAGTPDRSPIHSRQRLRRC